MGTLTHRARERLEKARELSLEKPVNLPESPLL
jgi:hypothetical protein